MAIIETSYAPSGERLVKASIVYGDFGTDDPSDTIKIADLQKGEVPVGMYVDVNTGFDGTDSPSAVTLNLSDDAGNPLTSTPDATSADQLMATMADNVSYDFTSARELHVELAESAGTINNLNAGAADVYVTLKQLPGFEK